MIRNVLNIYSCQKCEFFLILMFAARSRSDCLPKAPVKRASVFCTKRCWYSREYQIPLDMGSACDTSMVLGTRAKAES